MTLNILPYNSRIKENYDQLILDLMIRVEQTEEILTYCDSLYMKKGYCTEIDPPAVGWYDYTPGDYTKSFKSHYTGSWAKDSINNSICNPEVAKRVLLRIWHKEEMGHELSEYEHFVADSLNKHYRDDLINPSADSSKSPFFPKLYD